LFVVPAFDLVGSFKNAASRRDVACYVSVRPRNARRNKSRLSTARFYGFGGEGKTIFAAGPLANYQFAATLLFESHRLFQCVNGTFSLLIGWRTRGHSLQPQSWRSHNREQGFPPFCREPDDLVRNARDHWKQRDTNRKPRPERVHRNQHI